MSETWTFALICTDRGSHPPVVLHTTRFHGSREDLEGLSADGLTPTLPQSRMELDCSLCPRSPRIRHATMARLSRGAIDMMKAGRLHVEFDLSKLAV